MIKEPDKTPYITALIIAYNPDQRIVVSLEKLRYLVDFVVIIDNMSSDRSFLEELKIKYDEKFLKILDLNKNYGVASGLNKGIEWIQNNKGSSYILTLDQDTIVLEKDLKVILHKVPAVYKKNLGLISLRLEQIKNKPEFYLADFAMTSGNIINVEAIGNIRFRDEFFIDFVDYDFSFELKRRNYTILFYNHKSLDHRLGIKRHGFTYEPPSRVYYIIRNSTIMLKERKIGISMYFREGIIYSVLLILQGRPFSALSCTFLGICDAIQYFRR